MQITEVSSDELLAVISRPPTSVGVDGQPYVRSSGVHVSDIIRDLENKVTKPGKRPRMTDLMPEEKKRMGHYTSMGWAWEDIIREAMIRKAMSEPDGVERYMRLGEVEMDGIYASPDLFDIQDFCVDEFKATWRSMRRKIETDFWSWLVQTKAYCKMTHTNWARISVFWVCGDYRASGPQVKRYEIRYDDAEIQRNWDMLRGHADRMETANGRK